MVGREFSTSAVNSYVGRNSNSLEAQVSGMAMTGRGYTALNEDRTQIMNRMQGLRQDSMSAAGSYIDQGGINKNSASVLQGGSDQMKDLAKQLIPITLAMQQLKQQGMDPKGRQEELSRIGNKAAGVLQSNQLQSDMKSGEGMGAFSLAELKKKEADAAERLLKAMLALTTSVGKTSDELNELHKEAESAAKEFKETNEAKDEKGKEKSKFETVKMVAGTVQEMLEIGVSAYQNVAINQPMQMVANTAASANMENEKYNNWHSAMAGNMHERMNLNWKDAQDFGNNLADNQNNIHNARKLNFGIGGGIGATQMVVGAVGAVGPGKGLDGALIQNMAEGGKAAMSGAAGFVVEAAAQKQQTEMAALRVAGATAFHNAQKALTQISGQQLQGFRNHAMGINQTAGAMGGEVGEAFLNETGGEDFLTRMSDKGIGVKEFGALTLRGAQQMGSRFDKEQIFKAVDYERQGYGTAEQNMQRIGTLAAAGKGDAATDLGSIIESAMRNGLNSSKALDMIVENTAKINEKAMMAGAGADASVGITNAILRGIDQSNPNKEQGLAVAMHGYERGEEARTNTSASLPGLLNVDRAMKDFGVDRASAMVMTSFSTAETEALKGIETEKEKSEWLEGQGVNVSNMPSSWLKGDKLANKLNDNAAVSVLAGKTGLGYPMGNPAAYAAELDKLKNDKPALNALLTGKNLELLSPEQRQLRIGLARTTRLSGGVNAAEDMFKAASLKGIISKEQADKALSSLSVDSRKNLTDENRLGGRAESAQAAVGAGALGKTAAKSISALAESGRQAFEAMGKKGVEAERAWTKAAKETATNFGNSAVLMNTATSNLAQVTKDMSTGTQLFAASGAGLASAVQVAVSQIKDDMVTMANTSIAFANATAWLFHINVTIPTINPRPSVSPSIPPTPRKTHAQNAAAIAGIK